MVAIHFLVNVAALVLQASAKCSNKGQRRAWHTFSDEEKSEYINAELCIMRLPPKVGLPGARTLFDDLQANHQIQAGWTHFVGAFLPYHRLLMHTHEHFLRTECGYTGYQPYWDEPLDAGNFTSSIVFDPVHGFGGDGRESDGCITDGPFANYTNALGPGYLITDHCIDRRISNEESKGSSQSEVDACNEYTDFEDAWPCIQDKPHTGGHAGVGLEMANPISSPGDPLFYLHHTWLDKVWWDWQALDLPARLKDMTGRNQQDKDHGFGNVPGINGTNVFRGTCGGVDICLGDSGNTTTLTHVLSTLGLLPNVTIADVMDIGGGYLCY
ncbi:di-copper centre-containing protein, partial [Fusarium napiforme]